MHYMCF